MLTFHKRVLVVLLSLLLSSALIAYWGAGRTFLQLSLLPNGNGGVAWHPEKETDAYQGGLSWVKLHDQYYSLDFELFLSDVAEYPQASLALSFKDQEGQMALVDLSPFDRLTFNVKCSPNNVLAFTVLTVDPQITQLDDFLTYRSPATYFSCSSQWNPVTLDLTRLETPLWWLDRFGVELTKKNYQLDSVPKIVFGATFQSPKETASRVQLNELTLYGRDWRYMYLVGAFLLAAWSAFGIWLFRQHTQALLNDLKAKMAKDRPLVAYQQLSIEPRRDKDKDAILRFMATEYANPDVSVDTMVMSIGMSRTKINDILKAELGFTFTGYLNKLRLTEAARLLAESGQGSIAEIAYAVGYRNVSYFNKLFKEEYGCTPKTFKGVYEP